MPQSRKSARPSTVVKHSEPSHRGRRSAPLVEGAASSAEAAPDEPMPFGPEESPETDIAPTVLGHVASDRVETVETDTAPSVLDHDVLPAAPPPGPESCSESDGESVSAEDLH